MQICFNLPCKSPEFLCKVWTLPYKIFGTLLCKIFKVVLCKYFWEVGLQKKQSVGLIGILGGSLIVLEGKNLLDHWLLYLVTGAAVVEKHR